MRVLQRVQTYRTVHDDGCAWASMARRRSKDRDARCLSVTKPASQSARPSIVCTWKNDAEKASEALARVHGDPPDASGKQRNIQHVEQNVAFVNAGCSTVTRRACNLAGLAFGGHREPLCASGFHERPMCALRMRLRSQRPERHSEEIRLC